MSNVKPVPEGYRSVTPYLFIRDAASAISYYKLVFGATEIMRMPSPDGKVMHAELKFGDSVVMLGEENPKVGRTESAVDWRLGRLSESVSRRCRRGGAESRRCRSEGGAPRKRPILWRSERQRD